MWFAGPNQRVGVQILDPDVSKREEAQCGASGDVPVKAPAA